MSKQNIFFHVDLDAFFASVEQLDNPEYRNKPVIVGGHSRRGVVSTCSYEARKFGVHSAMPILKAHKLCPNGIFLDVRMQRYHEKSKEVMSIFNNFTPEVQQMSIDEAFLNMTGMQMIFGSANTAAPKLKKEVKEKTGLNISVGCATNKYIAKIASGKSKPNGLFIIPPGDEAKFMQGLELKEIWGIGQKTREKLIACGLATIPQILNTSEAILCSILGEAGGDFLYKAVRGELTELFSQEAKQHSISTERTFEYDLTSSEQINDILFYLSNEIMYRIIEEKVKSKTVAVKIRYGDFTTVTVQETSTLVNDSNDLYERAKKIFYQKYNNKNSIRLLGISVMNVENNLTEMQLNLFCDNENIKKRKVEETIYELSKKCGKNIVKPARLLKENE